MSYINQDDLKRICHEVSLFTRKADWQFKSKVIISFEFGNSQDFHIAKSNILQLLNNDLTPINQQTIERITSDGICEIDIFNITFRLICNGIRMTKQGPIGTAEEKLVYRKF